MKSLLSRISSTAANQPPSYEQAETERLLGLKMGTLADSRFFLAYLCVSSFDCDAVDASQRWFSPVEKRHAMSKTCERLLHQLGLCQTPGAMAAVEKFLVQEGKQVFRWADSSAQPPAELAQIAHAMSVEMPQLASQVADVNTELTQQASCRPKPHRPAQMLRRRHSLIRIDLRKLRQSLEHKRLAR